MNPKTFLEQFGCFTEGSIGFTHLRQLVLEFAVRGKLTEQNESESGEEVLSDARQSKERAIEEGRAAGKGIFVPLEEGEEPFQLPANWAWIRIGDTVRLVNGKAFKPSDWTGDGLPIVRIQNLNNEDASFNRFNGEVDDKFHIRSGDFLISWSGTPGTSFGAFIWERGHALLNQHIFRCEIYSSAINKAYLRLAINARLEEMISKAHGGVGLRHITKGKLEMIPVPLPPLPEQKRIVAKVDQLMALCDRLEAQQQERETQHTHLTRAALARFHEQPSSANLNLLFHKSFTIPPADLRKTILQLAVQGELTSSGTRQHKAERQSGTVEDFMTLKSGKTIPKEMELNSLTGEYLYLKVGDMNLPGNEVTITTSSRTVDPSANLLKDLIPAGSIIFPKRGGAIATNKKRIVTQPLFVDSNIMAMICPDFIDLQYLHIWILNIDLWELNSGTSVPQINNKDIYPLSVSFPSLDEQERIVTKVESLMKQVDHLEAQLTQSRATAEKLMEAIVAQLTTRS